MDKVGKGLCSAPHLHVMQITRKDIFLESGWSGGGINESTCLFK